MQEDKNLNKLFPKNKKKYRGLFFILGLETQNERFLLGVIRKNTIVQMGTFSKGLNKSEKKSLMEAIRKHDNNTSNKTIRTEPGICVEIYFKTIEENQLIDPTFHSFHLKLNWKECTWDRLILDNTQVQITHPDKMIWDHHNINKENFISYLIHISPFILPFLENRALTTIRYPNGIYNESFYQKNCPDYAPNFIRTAEKDDINYIICNDLSTLLWLGNQLAIEYHVPFQTINLENPLEIVFDLDPPDRDAFHLAIKAATEMKKIFDTFEIKSYPKLSGNKGIQIHIPIKDSSLTYDKTRIFTEFIARYLVERHPQYFTIERLKKNRGNKLYIDYVQHAQGKTIICPYSTRGRDRPTVAAPLYWDEVNKNLKVEKYDIPFVLKRLTTHECPFHDFFEQDNSNLIDIIGSLEEKSTS
ncbi:DNA ligase D [Terrihalobacillus insolitus]|uniref:DNA ligase D n=1 Tax=Terrihalobacillus insolitus TaxID=2950438 RepID=UPI002342500C|nr:DNA ligase D [Terrihalobacillus insolitus]MDC3414589.1 DNA ligase D [Terrihalobacillus insolitus]